MKSIIICLASATAATLSISPVAAFSPSPRIPLSKRQSSSSSLSASGKGFGEKTVVAKPTKPTPAPSSDLGDDTTVLSQQPTKENKGSTLLQQLRSRQAEERNAQLQKIATLKKTDDTLLEDPSAAAIPERVAQRMGKRMLPFVGIPLFGSTASFVGFWYLAAYRDVEFQPAIVATVSFVFLAVGLLGITYSVLSASWDDDREGSTFGADEFSKNMESLREGLSRTKENALLRERMAGMSDEEIKRIVENDK